jgi:hypothetical protein
MHSFKKEIIFIISVTYLSLFPISAIAQTGDSLVDMEIRSRQRDMEQLTTNIQDRREAADSRNEKEQDKLFTTVSLILTASSSAFCLFYFMNKRRTTFSSKRHKGSFTEELFGEYDTVLDKEMNTVSSGQGSLSSNERHKGLFTEKLFEEYDAVLQAGSRSQNESDRSG